MLSKKQWLLCGAAAVGILLIVIPQFTGLSSGKSGTDGIEVSEYKDALESELEAVIASLPEIESADIMLTLDGSGETVLAEDKTAGESSSSSKIVVSGGTVPIGERLPTVRGVAAVCRGSGGVSTEVTVTKLICAALGAPSNRVSVAVVE